MKVPIHFQRGRKRKAQSSGAADGEPTAAAAKGQKTALEAAPVPVPEAALVAAPGDEAMETPPPKQPKSVDEVSSETKEAWRVSQFSNGKLAQTWVDANHLLQQTLHKHGWYVCETLEAVHM